MAAEHEAALDRIDAVGLEPTVVLNGRRHSLPDPSGMGWRLVVECMENPQRFVEVWGVHGLAAGQIPLVHRTWLEVFDLGEPGSARRLCYLMSRHAGAVEADFARLYPGVDPMDLWRARAWRKLAGLVDYLPQNTNTQAALATDPEHAAMVVEAQAAAEKAGRTPPPSGPSLATWSPEVDVMTRVLDAVKENTYAIGKTSGSNAAPPKASQRPRTAYDSARLKMRLREHDRLVARVLPHQAQRDE